MKKRINVAIIVLASVVLVWGIVAAGMNLANSHIKTYTASAQSQYHYSKNGKIMTTNDVPDEDAYLYVKSDKVEVISQYEYYCRIVKHYKIVMNKAKSDYNADKTDAKKLAYDNAVTNYKVIKNTKNTMGRTYFVNSAEVFFGTYFPIIIFLGIALLINQKVGCRKEENKEE